MWKWAVVGGERELRPGAVRRGAVPQPGASVCIQCARAARVAGARVRIGSCAPRFDLSKGTFCACKRCSRMYTISPPMLTISIGMQNDDISLGGRRRRPTCG